MSDEIIIKFSLRSNFAKKKYQNFSLYMSKKLGNGKTEFEEQMFNELKNSCESTTNILFKKGIKDFFNSLFSDLAYLENIIDILIDTSLKKLNFIFDLINKESALYLEMNLQKIKFLARAASLEFNEEQKKIWKKLCDAYKLTKEKLLKTKNSISMMREKN